MAILAQRFLEATNVPPDVPHHRNVVAALTLQQDIAGTATRVVFDEDLHAILQEMTDDKQLDFGMVCGHAKLPAPSMWIEWHKAKTTNGVLDCGALLQQDAATGMVTCSLVAQAMGLKGSMPVLTLVWEMMPPPYTKDQVHHCQARLKWSFNPISGVAYGSETTQGLISLTMRSIVFALFLLGQPKITNTETIDYGPKLQRARQASGKQALISYSKLRLKFNVLGSRVSAPKYAATPDKANADGTRAKMRYHFCLGHYRVLHRSAESEKLIWIEGYFRGSPEAGVLIREKNLVLGKV